jgi:hypothetical protein
MTRDEVLKFLRENKIVVEASLHADGAPQAAAIGVAVTDDLHLVFDTVTTSRKHANLVRDPRCAFVAWHGGITIQIEGVAELLFAANGDKGAETSALGPATMAAAAGLAAMGGAVLASDAAVSDKLATDECLATAKAAYFAAFPDGPERESWPDIAYWRVRPTWIRASDYGTSPAAITVLDLK